MSTQSDTLVGLAVVLLVDDDPQVRTMLQRLLVKKGNYHVLTAGSGEEALEIFDRLSSTIDILITDLEMNGMNGVELCTRIQQKRPTLPVLFISGSANEFQFGPLPGPFLKKPFPLDVFLQSVGSTLDQKRPGVQTAS